MQQIQQQSSRNSSISPLLISPISIQITRYPFNHSDRCPPKIDMLLKGFLQNADVWITVILNAQLILGVPNLENISAGCLPRA